LIDRGAAYAGRLKVDLKRARAISVIACRTHALLEGNQHRVVKLAAKMLWTSLKSCVLCLTAALVLTPALADESQVRATARRDGDRIIVDAEMRAPVTVRVAWDVLTDFEHMAQWIPNLQSSEVLSRGKDTLRIRQHGIAHYGVLSFSFRTEREIRLEPHHRIHASNVGGNVGRMESLATLSAAGDATRIDYHAEAVPEFWVPPVLGPAFLRHEVEEQFGAVIAEMVRRSPRAGSAMPSPPIVLAADIILRPKRGDAQLAGGSLARHRHYHPRQPEKLAKG